MNAKINAHKGLRHVQQEKARIAAANRQNAFRHRQARAQHVHDQGTWQHARNQRLLGR